jgi:hypothetical protein
MLDIVRSHMPLAPASTTLPVDVQVVTGQILNKAAVDAVVSHVLTNAAVGALAMQRPELSAPSDLPGKGTLARQIEQVGSLDRNMLDQLSLDRHLGAIDQALQTGQPRTELTPAGVEEMTRTEDEFALLVALMQLLMALGRVNREASLQANKMQLDMTMAAGAKGIEASRERLIGAITAVAVGAAVGAAGMRQSFKGNQITTKSYGKNVGNANATDVQVTGSRSAGTAAATPHSRMRPERSMTSDDGKTLRVQSEKTGKTDGQDAVQKSDANKGNVDTANAIHGADVAESQQFFARATLINMLATSLQGMTTSGADVAASMDEAEKLLLMAFADTASKLADSQRDESAKSRQQSDATMQLLQSLNNTNAAMADHLVSKFG